VPALLKLSASDDRDTRLVALAALGNIGDEGVAEALTKAANPEGLYERSKATEALLDLGQRFVEAGKTADAEKIYRGLWTGRTAPEASHVRCAALRGLVAALGEKATDDLMAAMKSDDADVRAVAAEIAGTIAGAAMTQQLVASLKEAAPVAKVDTLALLARRADKAALPAALEALKDPDTAVRKAAIKAVAAIGKAEAIPTLLDALNGPERDERQVASGELILMPGDKTTAILVAALKTVPVEARRELLGVLAGRGARDQVDAVFACTKDEDEGVRVAALDAIGALGTEKSLPPLLELLVAAKGRELDTAERAADAICRRSTKKDDCAAALLAAVAKADVAPKCAILRVLGGLGSDKGLPPLRAALKDADAAVQEAAVRALARWPTVAVAGELLGLARDAKDPKHRVLALQGYIRLVGLPAKRPDADTLKMYQDGLAAATRPEEKKAILGPVSEVRDIGALRLVIPLLKDEGVKAEAEAAVIRLSDRLRDTKDAAARTEIRDALTAVIEGTSDKGRREGATKNLDRWYKEKPAK